MRGNWLHLKRSAAFTLVEILVAVAILAVLVVLLASLLGGVSRAWVSGEQQVETFQDGRAILNLMSRELAQAVISPRLQMAQDVNLPSNASERVGASNLFWQANLNSTTAGNLCEVGYFLDSNFRLMRFFVPPTDATNYQIFSSAPSDIAAPWTGVVGTATLNTTVSSNVIALWIRCFDANGDPIPWSSTAPPPAALMKFNSAAHFQPAIPGVATSFKYTSATTAQAHLLPAFVELTIITIDSKSLLRSGTRVPAIPAAASPTDVPNAIDSFNQQLIANNIKNAHTFSTRVSLKARGL